MRKNVISAILLAAAAFGSAFAGEGRIPIWQPTTITAPGHYVVTRDIAGVAGAPVIDIAADNVDVDLNGFTLTSAGGAPVIQSLNRRAIAIRRGKVLGGTYGIRMTRSPLGDTHVTIEDLYIEDWSSIGISLEGTHGFAVRRNTIGGPGIGEGILAASSVGQGRIMGVIEDNHLLNGGGISVTGGSNVVIVNNRLHDTDVPLWNGGAISLEDSYGGRIAGNTLHYIYGNGIYLGTDGGCEVRDNSIDVAFSHGIVVAGDGNLVLENVVKASTSDGIRVAGSANHIDRNLVVSSGQSGVGWGLHFTAAASDNTFGRNSARRSSGGPCAPGGGKLPTSDFCDESFGNSSFNDNYMPTWF